MRVAFMKDFCTGKGDIDGQTESSIMASGDCQRSRVEADISGPMGVGTKATLRMACAMATASIVGQIKIIMHTMKVAFLTGAGMARALCITPKIRPAIFVAIGKTVCVMVKV